ncbi:hypothetical protein ECDEC8C_3793 [Escherichia coli DEC8C]|nr:hypothetical protein ECDEC8C_3793 [Escherichia coli DEC8C]
MTQSGTSIACNSFTNEIIQGLTNSAQERIRNADESPNDFGKNH